MKGLVFTTFYDFCETYHGADVLDEVIEAADLPHGGAYTSVGTYPFTELVSLITALVKISGKPLNATKSRCSRDRARRSRRRWVKASI